MKFARLINFFFLLFALVSMPLLADEDVLRPHGRPEGAGRDNLPVYIGIEGGLNFNMYNSNFSWISQEITGVPVPTLYENNESGSGFSPHFGLFVDFSITRNMGIQLRVSYDSKYFGNSGDGIDRNFMIDNMPVATGIDWNVTANYLTVTPLFRYNFNENFFMTAGFVFQFLNGDIEQKFDANTAGNVDPLFLKWYAAMISAFGHDFQVKDRYGLEIGIGYKFPVAKKIFLVPRAGAQIMTTEVYQDINLFDPSTNNVTTATINNRSLFSIQAALALMFEL